MENKTIQSTAAEILRQIQLLPINPRLVKRYQTRFETIFKYCEENNIAEFRRTDADRICEMYKDKLKNYAFNEMRKAAYVLADYTFYGKFRWKQLYLSGVSLSDNYAHIAVDFENELFKTLSSGTVRVHMTIIRQFLNFLEENGIFSIDKINTDNVLDFVRKESVNHKGSMDKLMGTLKKFVRYLSNNNIVDIDADKYLERLPKRRQKVMPCFSDNEINLIFSQIDRSTEKGKRDYAVFTIALEAGLRASDIAKLKLTDIDWKNKTISVIQKKTKKVLLLPLQTSVGNAVADYILNARPETDNQYIFIRLRRRRFDTPINISVFNYSLREYLSKAGFDRKGWDGKTFHALRRTAGTNMIRSGVDISTVSQVLGHSKIESTKRYIILNTEMLRECCMELGKLHTKKEGLCV